MPLINLKTLYGTRYRIVDDGTDDPDRMERVGCQEIPGKFGAIYPWGPDGTLAVRVESIRVARRFAPFDLQVVQRGDEVVVFLFPPAMIDQVAAIIRAKRRRQVSPEQRARLAEQLRQVRKWAGGTDSTPVTACQEEGSGA